ncbi:unnamed protein product, partial [Amoebophrya sp. A120]
PELVSYGAAVAGAGHNTNSTPTALFAGLGTAGSGLPMNLQPILVQHSNRRPSLLRNTSAGGTSSHATPTTTPTTMEDVTAVVPELKAEQDLNVALCVNDKIVYHRNTAEDLLQRFDEASSGDELGHEQKKMRDLRLAAGFLSTGSNRSASSR